MPWYRNRRGEQLWYETAGTGCPVIMLHGWCMSSAVWKYQFDGLATAMTLLAPDLRGHGRSCGVSGHLDFEGFAADLVDLFDSLEISKAVLVGWSMGAQIAIQSCDLLMDRVAGLVLVSATPRFTASDEFPYGLADKESCGMRLKIQRNTKRALEGFYGRLFADGELESHAASAEIRELLLSIPSPHTAAILDALDALVRTDMRRLLGTISVPTVVINGALDRICLPEASYYLKTHIADAQQIVFPQCGHAPFLTYSDQFNTEIMRFVRRVCENEV